jgi:hypothetical protein
MRHDHLILRRDLVETLGGVLSDHMHRAMATGACRTVGSERDMHARQMPRQRSAVGPPFLFLGLY